VEGPIVAIEAADLRAAGRSPCALRRSEISATGERVRIFHTLRDTTHLGCAGLWDIERRRQRSPMPGKNAKPE